MSSPGPLESEDDLAERVRIHLDVLYPGRDTAALSDDVLAAMGIDPSVPPPPSEERWNEGDVVLITYGDTILDGRPPLQVLHGFLNRHLTGVVSIVHVLPFHPSSSDDGFAVVDHSMVNPDLGAWEDLRSLADDFDLMADLVLNHVSSRSAWFRDFVADRPPGNEFFLSVDPSTDLSAVVRPRTQPLLRTLETAAGEQHVWCTFSHDQVDLDYSNPEVILAVLRILNRLVETGVRYFRLDAVAYIWKRPGTSCIHLRETHEVVRLLHTLLARRSPRAALVTETNVPNRENLSYFGTGNEAHVIYNFSLPPLVLHTLLTGDAQDLTAWAASMPPAARGCTYLNFLASHDGIGVRPVEGLLDQDQIDVLCNTVERLGGRVSRYATDGAERPYELNTTYYEALRGTVLGPDEWQVERFICSQTILLGIEGIPALYIHSLLATPNDAAAVEATGHNRAINRERLRAEDLEQCLEDPTSIEARVFDELRRRIRLRGGQPAFHPNATQFTLHMSPEFFAVWRESMDRRQSLFAIHNVTDRPLTLRLSELNLILTDEWHDLLSDRPVDGLDDEWTLEPYAAIWLTNSVV